MSSKRVAFLILVALVGLLTACTRAAAPTGSTPAAPDADGSHSGWAQILDRLFVRPIAGRTLATFKAIAEATASAAVVEGSAEPSATKGGA